MSIYPTFPNLSKNLNNQFTIIVFAVNRFEISNLGEYSFLNYRVKILCPKII